MPTNSIQLDESMSYSPYLADNDKSPGFNWDKFQNDLDKLPETLYDIMIQSETSDLLRSISQKYGLPNEKGRELARITRDVIMAYLYIGDMPSQIAVQVGVDQTKARDIANQIVNELFKPVLADLKNVQKEKFGQKMTSSAPPGAINTGPNQFQKTSTPSQISPPEQLRNGTSGNLGGQAPSTPPPAPQMNRPPVPAQRPQNTPPPQQNNSGSGPKQYNVINLKDL